MNVGAQLRTSREARGLSLTAVAHTTRVQPRILAAIEQNDITVVPPRPFGRGFVRAYARELGLDADAVTRDYFEQFAPVEPPPVASGQTRAAEALNWTAALSRWPVVAVAAAAVVAVAFALRPSSAPSPAASPAAIGTSGTAPTPAAGDGSSAVATAAPTSPLQSGASAGPSALPSGTSPGASAPVAGALEGTSAAAANVTVVITATRRAWVSARSDGRRSLYQFVMPGSPQTLTGARDITLRVGDAGALRWTINGRDAGPMGRSGEVRDLRVTPATASSIR